MQNKTSFWSIWKKTKWKPRNKQTLRKWWPLPSSTGLDTTSWLVFISQTEASLVPGWSGMGDCSWVFSILCDLFLSLSCWRNSALRWRKTGGPSPGTFSSTSVTILLLFNAMLQWNRQITNMSKTLQTSFLFQITSSKVLLLALLVFSPWRNLQLEQQGHKGVQFAAG